MKLLPIACVALLAASLPAFSQSAPANPAGRWGDKNQPKGPSDYILQSDATGATVRIRLPDSVKTPQGQYLALKRVTPNVWRTASGANPTAVFELTGPNAAHLTIKGGAKGATWFSGWAIYTDDTLVRR